MVRNTQESIHYLSRGSEQRQVLWLHHSASHPSSHNAGAHRCVRFLLPSPTTRLQQLLSDSLPPWQLSKVYFHARQYKSPDVVESFENTFAAWRFGVQPDRFKVFVGHRMQTPPPPFCSLGGSIHYLSRQTIP